MTTRWHAPYEEQIIVITGNLEMELFWWLDYEHFLDTIILMTGIFKMGLFWCDILINNNFYGFYNNWLFPRYVFSNNCYVHELPLNL